jgi:hypothetical protein
MIFENKLAIGKSEKNMIPDFTSDRWFQDSSVAGGEVTVDPYNKYKMSLKLDQPAQARLIHIPVETGKAYTFSFGGITGGVYRLYKRKQTQHGGTVLVQDSTPKPFTFEVDAEFGGWVTLRLTQGWAGTFIFENLQLEEGYANTKFEPFKLINTKANLFPQKNKVLPFNSSKWQLHANAKAIDENTLELNATAGYQYSMIDLYLKPNTNYVISLEQCDGLYKINDDKAMAFSATYNQKGTVTFNTGNTKKVTLFFYSTGAGKFTFKKPMIEEGSYKSDYKEYVETARQANRLPKKNLLDFSEFGMRVYGGSPPTKLNWSSQRVSFDSVGNYSGIQPTISPILETGKPYTFSFKGHNLRLVANYGTLVGTTVVYDGNRTTLTFTPTKSTGFLAIENSSLTNASCWAEEVQLEVGNVATKYEPFDLISKKADNTVIKASYKNYPFIFKRESTETLNGVQYRTNNPRFKNGGILIEEGLTNTVANSDKVTELKTVGTYYGQVTYNHGLPKGGVVQSTDDKYTLQFELKKIGTDSRPFVSVVVGAQPPKDSWSWRLFDYDFHEGVEIEDLEDGWQRYTKTFTIKGSKGEYLQTFIKFICEVRDVNIDSLIRNVQIEERDYATTYTTGYRKSESLITNASLDKYAGAIEVEFSYKDIPSKSQYIFDATVPRWILYKDAWDNTVYVYLEGNSVIALPNTAIPNGKNLARIEWKNGSSSLYMNGVKIGTGTYTSNNTKGIKAFYVGSRYTGVEQLNNVIYSFKVEDRNGKVTYQF